ncbi:transporter substrate-binding domain-containing protein [Duganella sp. FT80W]|uniref:Transporter substrate-binding domain-containing protein n=1 Tax=Duganella guangzhouensis TaxID=2666084 RepID=A0A6I2KWK6_9BURK|nr:ABC transporter substrate-binding protein [Duganella guangzhouensis]MRW90388.1 transporter substrate-binding domain-containing protein [Duganella guangzhouensis]
MTSRLFTVLLACWLPLAGAQAAPLACAPARVGVSDLGYSSYWDGKAVRGSNVDVLAEVQKRSGCVLTLQWYPRGRLYAMFSNNDLELTGAALRSVERDRHGVWLPYTYTHFELVLTKKVGHFRSLAEFVDHSTARLNVARGVFYSPQAQAQLDRLQQQGRLEYVNDYNVVFHKIRAGRAEGTLAPATIHLLNQKQFGLLGKMSAGTISESPRTMVGLYVSLKVPPQVRQRYADALRSIVADGTMQKIYARYLDADTIHRLFDDGTQALLDALPPSDH